MTKRPGGIGGGPAPSRKLRPAGADDLGLRRALSDRLLPFLVAAMAFLAALALGGAFAASALAGHWQSGAASVLTVQVPQAGAPAADGTGTRASAVLSSLRATDGIRLARLLPEAELAELLRPWLGTGSGVPAWQIPGVIEVRLADTAPPGLAAHLAPRLAAVAPGTLVEEPDAWASRLTALARSLQGCAGLAVAVVGAVAAAVVAVATRAGLASRRDAIEIVHGLGATQGYIARRFARRATTLTAVGGALGTAAALPVLIGLADLARPFTGQEARPGPAAALPAGLWLALPALPLASAAIGWVTAQATVRRWLRRLP